MNVVYTERFKHHLVDAFEIGRERFGDLVAERTYERIIDHIEMVVGGYPRTGKWRDQIDCYQTWIPRTPFVVFYRINVDTVEVLAMFHHARDLETYQP